jgi:uncharacterized protein
MKSFKYILTGVVFGIIMTKSEAVSWYRIQEMFRFRSFRMYGIIGSAVITGIFLVAFIKTYRFRDLKGQPIEFHAKDKRWKRYLAGGSIFGIGWALTGACPGPIFVLLGQGYLVMIMVIAGALAGTFAYGSVHNRMPK